MSNNEIQTIQKIGHKNPTAERISTFFALRERHRGPVNLGKLKRQLRNAGEAVDENDFGAYFEDLVKNGYATAKRNKKRQITHAVLRYPVYQLGRAILEGHPLPAEKRVQLPKSLPVFVERRKATTLPPAPVKEKTVIFCIVKGIRTKIELEGKVSPETLDTIAHAFEGSKTGTG